MKHQPFSNDKIVYTDLCKSLPKFVKQNGESEVYLSSSQSLGSTTLRKRRIAATILGVSVVLGCVSGCQPQAIDRSQVGSQSPESGQPSTSQPSIPSASPTSSPSPGSSASPTASPSESPTPVATPSAKAEVPGSASSRSARQPKDALDKQFKETLDNYKRDQDVQFQHLNNGIQISWFLVPVLSAIASVVLLKLVERLVTSPFFEIAKGTDTQPVPEEPSKIAKNALPGLSESQIRDIVRDETRHQWEELRRELREELRKELSNIFREFKPNLNQNSQLQSIDESEGRRFLREVTKLGSRQAEFEQRSQERLNTLDSNVSLILQILNASQQAKLTDPQAQQRSVQTQQRSVQTRQASSMESEVPIEDGFSHMSSAAPSRAPLSPHVQAIVDAYNAFKRQKHVFEQRYQIIAVSETRESYAERYKDGSKPSIFAPDSNGSFWAVGDQQEQSVIWLLPKSDIVINEHTYKTLVAIFECHDYREDYSGEFELVAPAKLCGTEGEYIELRDRGVLRFYP